MASRKANWFSVICEINRAATKMERLRAQETARKERELQRLQKAAEAGWLALLDARNQTSHLYDDAVAAAVYQAIGNAYLPLWRELSEKLSAAV